MKNLKITGEINGVDFYFMRDSMTMLQSLNLKEVKIAKTDIMLHFGSGACQPRTYPEDEIPEGAFSGKTSLLRLVLPDRLKIINVGAFENCNNLEKITLPFASGVSSLGNLFDGYNGRLSPSLKTVVITGGTAVGDEFFQGCKTLEKIELSESIKTIGDYAFADCNAELEVNIPYGIESIGAYAFNNCKFLTDFNSKSEKKFDSLKTIGDYAFAGCTNLERVTFPNSLTSIGRNVLQNSGVQWLSLPFIGETREKSERLCYLFDINNSLSNSGIDSLKGVDVTDAETISDTAFSGYKNLINVSLNEGIIKIGDSAFKNCTALQTVKLPATLKYINDGAFQNCAGITAIELPQDLLYLGANVFTGCGEGLITESYGLYYVGGWIVGYSENVPSDILLYDNVRGVASEAFDGADIRSIDLDTSTQSIGDNAFRNCHQLEEVYFRGSIKYLGEYAFENCNALSSINLNGVSDKELREGMFSGCSSLKDVTLSIFITTIADSVFAGCESLEEIQIPDQVVSIGEDVFSGCINLQRIMVEAGNSFYETIDDCLVESSTGVLLYGVNRSFLSGSLNGVTAIADNAFAGMQGLEYFIMPDTLKSIGENAFADSGLIKIVISANVTSIAGSAFTDCDALATIEVEDGNPVYHSYKNSLIETESKTLVLGCSSSEIPADGSVTVIGDYAFYNCSGLTSVSIPEGVTAIGNYAFSNCGITGILSLPESLVTIGDYAFEMGRFTEVVIPANVTDLGVYAFNQCYGINEFFTIS